MLEKTNAEEISGWCDNLHSDSSCSIEIDNQYQYIMIGFCELHLDRSAKGSHALLNFNMSTRLCLHLLRVDLYPTEYQRLR